MQGIMNVLCPGCCGSAHENNGCVVQHLRSASDVKFDIPCLDMIPCWM